VEYKIIKNSSPDFWEDKKLNIFGLDKKVVIRTLKNNISIESHGVDIYLLRGGKKAKVSSDEQIIKGNIVQSDKLYVGDDLIVEFYVKNKIAIPKINWNLWAGVAVLLILILIIFFGWKKTSEANTEKIYQTILAEIKGNIVKSDDIKSIDPETGLSLLNEAKKKIVEIKNNPKHEMEVLNIDTQINEKLAVNGSCEVVGFEEIYDTKIADTVDRKYDKMTIVGDVVTLLDSNSRRVIDVNLISKAVTKFEIDKEILNVIDVAKANKLIYIYDGQNIWDLQKNKINLGTEVFSKIYYWNKNWYLLSQDGKIKKFSDGKISNWTIESALLIDKPVGMTIDGSVWVIDEKGNINNYEKGENKNWVPSIKFANEKIIGITTTADSDKVAVISDKKVYVFDKNGGKLGATNSFEKIGIVASQMGNNGQIYVLSADSKIYKVK